MWSATILYPLTILLPKYHISKLFPWKGLILIQVLEFLNLIYGCGVYITQDVNPKCVGIERYCPMDSKNVALAKEPENLVFKFRQLKNDNTEIFRSDPKHL